MDLQLKGKTALVTGASAGIGRAIAVGLAAEGVLLCIAARRQAMLEEVSRDIQKCGGIKPHIEVVDLTETEAPRRLVQNAQTALGHLDILVNAAGSGTGTGWQDAPDEKWLNAMTINFTQIRRMMMAIIPGMKERNWGRIINVTGKAEPMMANAGIPAKVAANALAKGLSRELGPHSITVNSIAPGKILSEQVRRRYSEQYKTDFSDKEIPLGRFGEPEEVAHLAVFLASPLAGYITGNVMHVDGGLHRFAFS